MSAGLPRFLPKQSEREFALRREVREAQRERDELRAEFREALARARFLEARLGEYLNLTKPLNTRK
jgi:hypothetical protein